MDFDQEPGADEYDDPTAGGAAAVPAPPARVDAPAHAPSAPSIAAPAAVKAPVASPAAPAPEVEGIPGMQLRRGAEAALADIDMMPILKIIQPSGFTEYLSRSIGEHQVLVDVDATAGQAITTMMRQAHCLVLVNQKIVGKAVVVAEQLEALEPKLESYLFSGDASVIARLHTAVGTIVPAARKVLEDVLSEVDRFVFKLVKAHVDAAVDGHELTERRRDAERLISERDVARAAEQGAKERLAEYKELSAAQLADAKVAGTRLAMVTGALGAVVGAALAFGLMRFAA